MVYPSWEVCYNPSSTVTGLSPAAVQSLLLTAFGGQIAWQETSSESNEVCIISDGDPSPRGLPGRSSLRARGAFDAGRTAVGPGDDGLAAGKGLAEATRGWDGGLGRRSWKFEGKPCGTMGNHRKKRELS